MSEMTNQNQPTIGARLLMGLAVRLILFPVAIMWPAGTWKWWEAWVLIGMWMAFLISLTIFLLHRDPALLIERMKAGPVQKGQKTWDKVVMLLMFALAIGFYIIPGFDVVRFEWSEPFPLWIEFVAMIIHIPCFVFLGWVMKTNTYLSPVVKIAHDRGHQVVTDGPYAIVRHPMYSAVIVLLFVFPVSVGSKFGLIPAALMAALFVIRTYFEDRTLHAELPGYTKYARITLYRLIPGIW